MAFTTTGNIFVFFALLPFAFFLFERLKKYRNRLLCTTYDTSVLCLGQRFVYQSWGGGKLPRADQKNGAHLHSI